MTNVFLGILHLSVLSSFLILAVLLLRPLLKKAPKWLPCLLWGMVALRLVLPFQLESRFSLLPNWQSFIGEDRFAGDPAEKDKQDAPSDGNFTMGNLANGNAADGNSANGHSINENNANGHSANGSMNDGNLPSGASGAEKDSAANANENVSKGWNMTPANLGNATGKTEGALSASTTTPGGVSQKKDPGENLEIPKGSVTLETSESFDSEHMFKAQVGNLILNVAAYVWFAGLIVMLSYALVTFWKLKRRVAASVRREDGTYSCDEIGDPFILGVLRPGIYLPSDIDQEERESILRHERAHLSRGDHFWKPIGFVILSVYWFQPLCWIAYVLFCKDVELACDEKATRGMDRQARARYCQALLNCSADRRGIAVSPLAFGEVSTRSRIKAVLSYKRPSFWILTVSLVACAFVCICFMTSPKSEAAQTDGENGMEDAVNKVGDAGLQEDSGKQTVADADQVLRGMAQDVQIQWLADNQYRYELADLDGNGVAEYVEVDNRIYEEVPGAAARMKVYWNQAVIYEYEDPCTIDPGDWAYLDLDRDGERELFLTFRPRVNDSPLVEYIVLKQKAGGWEPLEMIHGDLMMDNALPISVKHNKEPWQAEITCEGLDKTILVDVAIRFQLLKERLLRGIEEADEQDKALENYYFEQSVMTYSDSFEEPEEGWECAYVAPWGIWEIEPSKWQDVPCLMATHGILRSRNDLWGLVDVFFDYDESGRARLLDMRFRPQELLSDDPYVGASEEEIYEGSTPRKTYAEIARTYYNAHLHARETDDFSDAYVASGRHYVNEYFRWHARMSTPVFVLEDINQDGVEEFFVGHLIPEWGDWYELLDAYTWKDGRAYRLMGKNFGERTGSCILCKDGVIKDQSNGGMDSWREVYYELPKGGVELVVRDDISSEGNYPNDAILRSFDQVVDIGTIERISSAYQRKEVTYQELTWEAIESLKKDGKSDETSVFQDTDREKAIQLCADACGEFVRALRDGGEGDFTPYVSNPRLISFLQNKLGRPHSFIYGLDGENAEGTWKFYETTVEPLEQERILYVRGIPQYVPAGGSETSLLSAGAIDFLLAKEEGRIVIRDWYWEGKESLDVSFRGEFSKEFHADFWEEPTKYGAIMNEDGTLKEILQDVRVDGASRVADAYPLERMPDTMWEAYGMLAREYYDAQRRLSQNPGSVLPYYVNSLAMVGKGSRYEELSKLVFLVHDVNGDGREEFFIGRHYDEWMDGAMPDADGGSVVLYDAYTWRNGRTYRLVEGEIGERNGTCSLLEGGLILSSFSGTADDFGFEILKLPNNGTKLELLEEAYAARRENGSGHDFYRRTDYGQPGVKITEEEYKEAFSKYGAAKLSYTDLTPENILALEKSTASLTFGDLANLDFIYASGAGAWGESFTIYEDGSFAGGYDAKAGEAWLYDTSRYFGQFDVPVKIDDYTYRLTIRELTYEKPLGTVEYVDGIQMTTVTSPGLEAGGELLLFLPGKPVSDLPKEYFEWWQYHLVENGDWNKPLEKMPFYGIYSELNGGAGYKQL